MDRQGTTKIITTTMDKILSQKGKWINTELKLHLLSTCGNKAVKAKRLYDGWAIRRFNTEEDATAAKKKRPKKKRIITGLKTFPSSAKWQELFPSATAVQEPVNPTFKQPRAPTVQAKDAQFVPKKYEFDEVFAIPSFKGKREQYKMDRRLKIKIDAKTKRPKKKSVARTKGCVNEKFK